MEKKKILLVDDDADFTEATKLLLESRSYEVTVAHDGKEGLKKVQTEEPNLIILDVMMPEMDAMKYVLRSSLTLNTDISPFCC